MKVLLLWSGGIESTSLLKWQLENTDNEVFAHRIIFHNYQDRDADEAKAIANLIPLMTAIRPFHYDTSEVSVCEGQYWPQDKVMYHSLGTMALVHHKCERMLKGYCAEDQWSRVWQFHDHDDVRLSYHRHDSLEEVYHDKAVMVKAFLPETMNFDEVIKIYDTAYWTKSKHCKYLGEMLQYTWSCRKPKLGKECYRCHSCREKHAAMKGTSYIPEVAEGMANGTIE